MCVSSERDLLGVSQTAVIMLAYQPMQRVCQPDSSSAGMQAALKHVDAHMIVSLVFHAACVTPLP